MSISVRSLAKESKQKYFIDLCIRDERGRRRFSRCRRGPWRCLYRENRDFIKCYVCKLYVNVQCLSREKYFQIIISLEYIAVNGKIQFSLPLTRTMAFDRAKVWFINVVCQHFGTYRVRSQ